MVLGAKQEPFDFAFWDFVECELAGLKGWFEAVAAVIGFGAEDVASSFLVGGFGKLECSIGGVSRR